MEIYSKIISNKKKILLPILNVNINNLTSIYMNDEKFEYLDGLINETTMCFIKNKEYELYILNNNIVYIWKLLIVKVPTNTCLLVTGPTDSKPTDSKPMDSKPTDSKPTDYKPTDSKPTHEKKNKRNGANSSKQGKKYENQVYQVTSQCINQLTNLKFNTQNISELGGNSSKNDLICNWKVEKDVAIEIKSLKSPDWVQCILKYDEINNKWNPSPKNSIPNECKQIFINLFNESKINLYNGTTPIFIKQNFTLDEWNNYKSQDATYKDVFFDCPDDTIKKMYALKGNKYIQISKKGLYHLGNDYCNFGVPEFICPQQIRIRVKNHKSENSQGFCELSVTMACQPKNINYLITSPYNLDDKKNIPTAILKYIEIE